MKSLISILSFLMVTVLLTNCSSTPAVTPEQLKIPFVENRNEIDGCYEKVARKQPDLGAGTTELKFLINEDGKVFKTIFLKKKSTLNSKLLNACIKKAVSSWDFPKGKNLEVVYPFQFEGKSELGDESKTAEPAKNDSMDIINTTPPEESGDAEEETPAE